MSKKIKIIIILIILIFLIIFFQIKSGIKIGNELNRLNNMNKDIIILEDAIAMYYLENGNIPIKNTTVVDFKNNSQNPNDNGIYYEIDLSLLENLDLSYGNQMYGEDDIYVINEISHTIYYLAGIEYDEKIYYTRDVEYVFFDVEDYK